MEILTVQYAAYDKSSFKITYDTGPPLFVPDDLNNRHRKAISTWVNDGNEIAEYEAPWKTDVETAREYIKGLIQTEKKAIRDGGVTVDGVLFDTDAAARLAYHGFALDLASDSSATVANWKPSENEDFVTMDADTYAGVWAAYKGLETAIYAWQATQNTLVDTATTVDELDQISTVYE